MFFLRMLDEGVFVVERNAVVFPLPAVKAPPIPKSSVFLEHMGFPLFLGSKEDIGGLAVRHYTGVWTKVIGDVHSVNQSRELA